MGKKNKNKFADHDVAPKRGKPKGAYDVTDYETPAAGGKRRKLSKRERKELRRQQAETEKRLVAEGVISPRVRYAPRSFLWNILAVCLAFFLGIFFALGAILFAGAKSSVKSILGLIGVEYGNLIAEEYADQSVIDLFRDVTQTLSGGLTNLNTLGKYTPLLGNTLNTLSESLGSIGVHLNVDELMNVDFSGLGGYFQENVIQTIKLGETLGLTPDSSPLMIGLCYGAEGEDYEVVDGAFQMKEGKHATTISDLANDATGLLNRVTVESALNVNANSPAPMRYLAYGSENVTYQIVDGAIVMLENSETGEPFAKKTLGSITAEGSDVIGDARLGDLMDMSGANNFMATIQDWRISDLKNSNRINRLKISQIIKVGENPSLLMNAIRDWRINDLTKQENIDSLCIGDVLAITPESPKILQTLQDATLGSFGDAVNGVRLCDLLDDDLSQNKFLRGLQKSTLKTLANDIQSLTVADVFGDDIYAYSALSEIQSYTGKAGEKFDNYDEFIAYYKTSGKNDADFSQNRPTVLKNVTVTSSRVLASSGAPVLSGWFAENEGRYELKDIAEADLHLEVAEDNSVLRYYENKPRVTPVYVWEKVDYDKSEAEWETLSVVQSGEGFVCTYEENEYPVAEDDFGYYFRAPVDGVNTRIDLERAIESYLLDGAPLPEGTAVRYQKPTETDEGYYYAVLREYVEERYYEESDPAHSYALGETHEKFTGSWQADDATHTDEEVDRYLNGIWYLLLDNGNGADTQIAKLSEDVNRISDFLDSITLWEMYVHGLLNTHVFKENFLGEKNLNECTIATVLGVVNSL